MATPARELLTLTNLFDLFHRTDPDPGRWLSMSDSVEYLSLVTYLVLRNRKELEGGNL